MPPNQDPADVARRLAEPFPESEVKTKPQTVSGNRALAIHYVDARVVMDRLDDVFGIAGWQDSFEVLPDGAVVCTLKLRFGDEWLTKQDVGGPSEQPDEGDKRKAAFSDALKRAAVKLGIGRYLYRLPRFWADYDPQKRQLKNVPPLPDWALPGGKGQDERRPAERPQPRPTPAPPPQTNGCAKANQEPLTPPEKESLADWGSWLQLRPSVEAVNDKLRLLSDMRLPVKRAAWQALHHHARGRGWAWDHERLVFVATAAA